MTALPHELAAFAGFGAPTSPRLWRSLEELAGSASVRAYLEEEFPDEFRGGAVDRRTLLRLMSASLTLAGLAACGPVPPKNAPLLSEARKTPNHTPGVPLVFATSLELDGLGRGVLVTSQEGRPIKVHGNALHPASVGSTDVFAEAEILSLYDPDRSVFPTEHGASRSWADVARHLRPLREEFVANGGRGLRILLPPLASPTLDRLIRAAGAIFPHAIWHRYSPLGSENVHAGATLAFGQPLDPIYDLTQADAILTLGGDLFAEAPGHIRYAADYMARRRAEERRLPGLYCAESTPSLVGARADERLSVPPREIEAFAIAVAAILEGSTGDHPLAPRVAAALRDAGARALVTVGREQPARLHALAHRLNANLGAIGTTVRVIEPVLPPIRPEQSLEALAAAIAGGTVNALMVLGGNPVYDAPADLDFGSLVRRLPWSLHLGLKQDETALACRWHLPQRHALESWGDLRAFDGTVGLRQPSTTPLVPGASIEEVVAAMAGTPAEGRELVQATWREIWAEDFAARWAVSLEAGVIAGSASPTSAAAVTSVWPAWSVPPRADRLTAVFAPDPSVWDGQYAGNAWLQELPKPLTKQVWGNAALLAPETAAALELRTGDEVEIEAAERRVTGPVMVVPGHAPDTVTLTLGYGRMHAGRVGNGIGFDAYRLRTTKSPWLLDGITLTPTGRRVPVITTQMHHGMEGRNIVRVVADPRSALPEQPPRPSLYPEMPYEGHAWGMAIDLDACIGCNACVVACQAENNVPVVGPEEVARGREMHWLRIDRYYAGTASEPRTYFQPVLCMHCEKAPCEVVCPVNATVHSAEGLNDMVYNRCIGTRTCSNNCPYKVRRFNFFDYQATDYAPSAEAMNPQVTVRERGVMEKCTYCVHRISAGRIAAKLENRPIRDGDIITACANACPTRAIVFGDLNDPTSAVSRLKGSPRNYALLGELNTQPRTTYLARVEALAPASGLKE